MAEHKYLLPVEVLVDAIQDRPHREIGIARAAKSVKLRRERYPTDSKRSHRRLRNDRRKDDR